MSNCRIFSIFFFLFHFLSEALYRYRDTTLWLAVTSIEMEGPVRIRCIATDSKKKKPPKIHSDLFLERNWAKREDHCWWTGGNRAVGQLMAVVYGARCCTFMSPKNGIDRFSCARPLLERCASRCVTLDSILLGP